MQPDLSIIIPVYNRGDLIRYTLESITRASDGLNVETIIVDDGSTTPVADSLARIGFSPSQLFRQENQGLLFARLAGLTLVTGRHVLFLDSDDLVSTEKFRLQLAAMTATGADISYSDTARCEVAGDFSALQYLPDPPTFDTTDGAEFCIVVQPVPHSPIFRTDWLQRAVDAAFFPADKLYNSVAEIWFYHNAAIQPGRSVRVPGPHTIIGSHPGVRLTNNWERLGVASLAVMEAFARACPRTTETVRVRALVGEVAFRSWRRLPRDFSAEFGGRLLKLWRELAAGHRSPSLGGSLFRAASTLVGAENAGHLFRRLQAQPYEQCRTMDDAAFGRLLRALPAP